MIGCSWVFWFEKVIIFSGQRRTRDMVGMLETTLQSVGVGKKIAPVL